MSFVDLIVYYIAYGKDLVYKLCEIQDNKSCVYQCHQRHANLSTCRTMAIANRSNRMDAKSKTNSYKSTLRFQKDYTRYELV